MPVDKLSCGQKYMSLYTTVFFDIMDFWNLDYIIIRLDIYKELILTNYTLRLVFGFNGS